GLELLVPPQSLLIASHVIALVLASTARARQAQRVTLASLGLQIAFIGGGLVLYRAPLHVWRSLLLSPALVARKLVIYARIVIGRTPMEWRRGPRLEADQT